MRGSLHIIILAFIAENFTAAKPKPHDVFLRYELKGGTVRLSVDKRQQNLSQIKWKKDDELIASEKEIKPAVNHKFTLNATDCSLIIINVTEEDAGRYQVISGKWEDKIIEYQLEVEEAVPKAVIDVSLSNSTGHCQMTVKCSANGQSVTFDCDLQTCTQTFQHLNISLTKINFTAGVTSNENVKCITSNHVSTETSSRPLESECSEKIIAVVENTNISLTVVIAMCCGLVVCILVIGPTCYCYRTKLQNDDTQERDITTIYSTVCKPQSQPENNAANTSTSTVYDVPSKCVLAPQNASVPNETQQHPPEERTVTVNAETEGQSAQDQLTVYWKLGQI